MSTTSVIPVNSTITNIDNAILKSLNPASQALVAIAQESKTTDSPLVKILTDVGSTTAVLAQMPSAGGVLGTVEGISGIANIVDQFILGAVSLFHPQVATVPTPVVAPTAPALIPIPTAAVDPLVTQVAALTAQNQALQEQLAKLMATSTATSTPATPTVESTPATPATSATPAVAHVSTGDRLKEILTLGIDRPKPAMSTPPAK